MYLFKEKDQSTLPEILKISDVSKSNISRAKLYKFIKDNNYEKIGPGIYVSPDKFPDELWVLHKRCPSGVISHDEALFHYGLIDREPIKPTITVYSGYNATRLIKSGYQIFYVNKELLNLGKAEINDNYGNFIPIYDLERTIIDMIRNRKSFEIQDFSTAMKSYAKKTNKNLKKLIGYSKVFGVNKLLETYMEILL